jgi:AAA+ superfamily predicted ATPase
MNRNQQTNADITALLKARNTLLWIVTREEVRVERAIRKDAGAASMDMVCWDCADGLTTPEGQVIERLQDPQAALGYIESARQRCVFVMRDLHQWMDPATQRKLRSLARSLQSAPRNEARSIIVLTPSSEVPAELAGHAIVIDYPLPEREEMGQILDDALRAVPPEIAETVKNGIREAAIDAAIGLNAEEAASCYAKSLVTTRSIDPGQISAEKRRVIARENVLTWYEPDPRGLDAVGGLEHLKSWLVRRRLGLGQKARSYGLPAPKGCLLVGVPGCGKSLTAKAVAAAWGLPLLRLDLGALRSKYVGESEGNIRRALATAETVAPCILWIDEIEKALAGATGAQGDGGVSADALGAVLSWMQERQGSVFVVATANDVSGLPPELLRKGRFDELFFVDLPTGPERVEILKAALRAHGRDPEAIAERYGKDFASDAEGCTDGFTGAEIAALVPEALFAAFADGEREVCGQDLWDASDSIVPLSTTAAEKLSALRTWAKGKCRPASAAEQAKQAGGRALDL